MDDTISGLEYKLFKLIGREDLIEGKRPRTPHEEEEHANKVLKKQLRTFEEKK